MVAAIQELPKERVLIIDDDPMVRESLEMLFAHYGWDVIALASGDDALIHLPPMDYSLAVVDHLMDGIDGIEVVRRLKSRSPAPVFMITGCIDPKIRLAAESAGVDRFFCKPVQAITMLNALNEL